MLNTVIAKLINQNAVDANSAASKKFKLVYKTPYECNEINESESGGGGGGAKQHLQLVDL